jgi:hypothetical protein
MSLLATAATALTIVVWPQGLDGPSDRWTLRCGPTGGTLPARAAACRKLNSFAAGFRPIPKDVVCTDIYGGPQVARITGRYKGRRIWVRFARRNGCEIARWDRLRPLLPRGGAA